MLSKISQTNEDKYHMVSHMEPKNISQTHNNKENGGYQGLVGGEVGRAERMRRFWSKETNFQLSEE